MSPQWTCRWPDTPTRSGPRSSYASSSSACGRCPESQVATACRSRAWSGLNELWRADGPGRAAAAGTTVSLPNWTIVESRYFATLRIPLDRGPGLQCRRPRRWPTVAIVGEGVARRLWPGKEAVGQYASCSPANLNVPRNTNGTHAVVGVVGDIIYGGAREAAPLALYVPVQQRYSARPLHPGADVRTATARRRSSHTVMSLNPNLPVLTAQTLESQQSGPVVTQLRIAATVAGVSAGRASAGGDRDLWRDGLYGDAAHPGDRHPHVARRQRTGVVGMVLRRAMLLVVIGVGNRTAVGCRRSGSCCLGRALACRHLTR